MQDPPMSHLGFWPRLPHVDNASQPGHQHQHTFASAAFDMYISIHYTCLLIKRNKTNCFAPIVSYMQARSLALKTAYITLGHFSMC